MNKHQIMLYYFFSGFMILSLTLVLAFKPVSLALPLVQGQQIIKDRNGIPLTYNYLDSWNIGQRVPLHQMPPLLKQAFIESEDRRFFEHGGIDWAARTSAVTQNLRNGKVIRGASTISEQVVRMVHPRQRTVFAKIVETFEAWHLENRYTKAEIFEFYLNQIPYAAHRRGVVQAAQYYFNRSLSTLTEREILALVILAQAPSAFDLYRYPGRIENKINNLGAKVLESSDLDRMKNQILALHPMPNSPDVSHFVRHVRMQYSGQGEEIKTTLDLPIQTIVQNILDRRVSELASKKVNNAAALVMDHTTGDIISWAVAGAGQDNIKSGQIDPVLTPRQPGSALKPFLYAAALEKGWSAATFIDDSPLSEAVGTGLHRFRNYSYTHYGQISVREALGNSLNIPALLTIRHVGIPEYLSLLWRLGFRSLESTSDFYDEGLALGNGEVTLLELVGAYTSLANKGRLNSMKVLMDSSSYKTSATVVFTPETTSVISNILSDPWARYLEFGRNSVLNLPTQTAVKTGTSTDYRDAWAIGYNDRYIVGIWMGNLDHSPMDGVTGSTGPALALRAIFSDLDKFRQSRPLYISPRLSLQEVCIRLETPCRTRSEWMPYDYQKVSHIMEEKSAIELVRPTDGLAIAYDPRIPPDHQKFRFEIEGNGAAVIEWVLDGHIIGRGPSPSLLWPVREGRFSLEVRVEEEFSGISRVLGPVSFNVR